MLKEIQRPHLKNQIKLSKDEVDHEQYTQKAEEKAKQFYTFKKQNRKAFFYVDDTSSSDDEFKKEYMHKRHFLEKLKLMQDEQNSIINQLPQPQNIIETKQGFAENLMMGWRPDTIYQGPIAINYPNITSKAFYDAFINEELIKYCIVYLSAQPANSHELFYFIREKSVYEKYPFKINQLDSHILHFQTQEFYFNQLELLQLRLSHNRRPYLGANPQLEQYDLIFESNFESGNLDFVVRYSQTQYYLFLKNDTNSYCHTQWYNFRISNMIKGKVYSFTIVNMSKAKSLYLKAKTPYTRSKKRYKFDKIDWSQKYTTNEKYSNIKQPIHNKVLSLEDQKKYYTLSFDYIAEYDHDEVQFAYCIPYTYSQLMSYLSIQINNPSIFGYYFQQEILCQSVGGLPIPLITITDFTNSKTSPMNQRTVVIILARQHPYESNSSIIVEEIISKLLLKTKEMKALREKAIFKIVPMVNPDGVVAGNSRCNLAGKDTNRQYNYNDDLLCPETESIKKLIIDLQKQYEDQSILFFDIHGHSKKRGFFAYSCKLVEVQQEYWCQQILMKLFAQKIKLFEFIRCNLKKEEFYKGETALEFASQQGIMLSYTLNISCSQYYDDKKGYLPFTEMHFKDIGIGIIEQIQEYIYQFQIYQKFRQPTKKEKKKVQTKYNHQEVILRIKNGYKVSDDHAMAVTNQYVEKTYEEKQLEMQKAIERSYRMDPDFKIFFRDVIEDLKQNFKEMQILNKHDEEMEVDYFSDQEEFVDQLKDHDIINQGDNLRKQCLIYKICYKKEKSQRSDVQNQLLKLINKNEILNKEFLYHRKKYGDSKRDEIQTQKVLAAEIQKMYAEPRYIALEQEHIQQILNKIKDGQYDYDYYLPHHKLLTIIQEQEQQQNIKLLKEQKKKEKLRQLQIEDQKKNQYLYSKKDFQEINKNKIFDAIKERRKLARGGAIEKIVVYSHSAQLTDEQIKNLYQIDKSKSKRFYQNDDPDLAKYSFYQTMSSKTSTKFWSKSATKKSS